MGAFLGALLLKVLPVVLTGVIGYLGVKKVLGSGSELKQAAKSLINGVTGADLTGAQTAQNEYASQEAEIARNFSADEAQKQRDWQMEMDSTKYQRTLSDMRAAGVNPMLMMGGQSPSGSSGVAASASMASPSGLGAAASMSDLMALLTLPKQLKLLDAQVKKTDADATKAEADASATRQAESESVERERGLRISNDFAAATAAAREESINITNDVSRATLSKVYTEMDEIEARTKKLIEEAKTEDERRDLMSAQSYLARANAHQVLAMLPYNQLLVQAKTAAEQASARLSIVNAAYQQGLIDNGYLDALTDAVKSDARSKDAIAEMNEIRAAIRNGTYGTEPTGSAVLDFMNGAGAKVVAGLTNFVDNLNPLGGILR